MKFSPRFYSSFLRVASRCAFFAIRLNYLPFFSQERFDCEKCVRTVDVTDLLESYY